MSSSQGEKKTLHTINISLEAQKFKGFIKPVINPFLLIASLFYVVNHMPLTQWCSIKVKCVPQEYLAMSGDTFGYHNLGGREGGEERYWHPVGRDQGYC